MLKFVLGAGAFFIVSFVASGALASLVLTPMFKDRFGPLMRSAETAAAGFPAMIAGFVILSLAAAWLYPRMAVTDGWWMSGLLYGLFLWVLAIGHYAIVSGWSSLPPGPTILSGVISGTPFILAAIALAFVYR